MAIISGTVNNDSLNGGGGSDLIDGQLGNDTLNGQSGNDTIIGGVGNDIIDDFFGNDILFGGEGNDNLDGGPASDTIFGGNGNDTLSSGTSGVSSTNILFGEDGDDQLFGDGNEIRTGFTPSIDILDGGSGNDTLLSRGLSDTLNGGDGDDLLETRRDGDDILNGGNGNDTLNADGILFSSSNPNVTLNGGNGSDSIRGGFGDDNLNGGSGNDTLSSGLGDDILNGGSGNDFFFGSFGNDIAIGGGGQDRFDAFGGGNDIITDFGGVGTGTNPSQAVIDEVDIIEFSDSGQTAKNLLLTQNGSDLEITFEGNSSDKVVLKNFNLEDLDNLSQGIGNILFDNDLTIQDSFDVVNANQLRSTVFNPNTVTFLNDLNNNTSGFNNSDDVINGQGGNDTLSGLSGNDLLRGGDGNDTLVGGNGVDTLVGGNGEDILDGGNGPLNTLTGGSDADIFVLRSTQSQFITDFEVGIDKFLLDDGLTFGALSFTQLPSATTIEANNSTIGLVEGVSESALNNISNFMS
ncbi:calcium-binding protein [Moorena sp. SIO4G3]|uniref:calcium-binding protein n=1 Tax=Moorena sp. SIO4G3 TaxID=2607821 RepID=UPI0014295616|nr:calcium-binding protein [Moorena sp. SIO4G3]NEO76774.1 calcium-binding protein [Moorena sp. SIO4G3]